MFERKMTREGFFELGTLYLSRTTYYIECLIIQHSVTRLRFAFSLIACIGRYLFSSHFVFIYKHFISLSAELCWTVASQFTKLINTIGCDQTRLKYTPYAVSKTIYKYWRAYRLRNTSTATSSKRDPLRKQCEKNADCMNHFLRLNETESDHRTHSTAEATLNRLEWIALFAIN